MPGRRLSRSWAVLLAAGVLSVGLVPVPAQAAGRVVVDNDGRGAVIDSRYSTELTVSGRGFQSIKGGHGGIYVWFGAVEGRWQPSRGGKSGTDFVYVPDSESRSNAGFQRYVAFPGSDTASSANGGTISADGSWSVRLMVPGPTFQGVGRDGTVRTVDCTKVTCGVITVGAHGVHNANNETFTPVAIRDTGTSGAVRSPSSTAPSAGSRSEPEPGSEPGATSGPSGSEASESTREQAGAAGASRPGKASLAIDRPSAVAGRALSFVAQGLTPGQQLTAILDDGLVASGPHLVGADGRVAGVLPLPAEVAPGTHELRVFGAGRQPSVRFAIAADAEPAAVGDETPAAATDGDSRDTAALAFAVGAGVLFAGVGLVTLRRSRGRRAVA
ncbi:hypothetical protein [Nocardioides sp. 616]|uniref:hypothetical protein n=1 Tax=Nocardioides sp. 616 TaxID=2268090 RepID=UPI000CE2D4EC|nr:hypothetical protein [Nocardioides sp. 616]